jgi:hypothetical protein
MNRLFDEFFERSALELFGTFRKGWDMITLAWTRAQAGRCNAGPIDLVWRSISGSKRGKTAVAVLPLLSFLTRHYENRATRSR